MLGVPVLVQHLSAQSVRFLSKFGFFSYKPASFSAHFVPCFSSCYNTLVVIIIVVFRPFSPYNTKHGNVVPTRNWT